MKVRFIVDVEIDTDIVATEGKRYGLPLDRALESVISDCECRLHDSISHRDGVQRVGVRMIDTPVESAA